MRFRARPRFTTVNDLNKEERVFFHKKFDTVTNSLAFLQENSNVNVWNELPSMRHAEKPYNSSDSSQEDSSSATSSDTAYSSSDRQSSDSSSSNNSYDDSSSLRSSSVQSSDASSSEGQSPTMVSELPDEMSQMRHSADLDQHIKVTFNIVNTTLDLALDFNEFYGLIRNFQIFRELSGGRWTKHLGYISKRD